MGVELEAEALLRPGGGEAQADEHAAGVAGHEVGAGDREALSPGELELHVAVAGGEPLGRPDPLVVEREPQAV
jgi:hypothetical protein